MFTRCTYNLLRVFSVEDFLHAYSLIPLTGDRKGGLGQHFAVFLAQAHSNQEMIHREEATFRIKRPVVLTIELGKKKRRSLVVVQREEREGGVEPCSLPRS